MTERFIVDDAGTLIDMQTRDMFDIVEEVCPMLNELHEENQGLKNDCGILVQSNQDYRKENEQLKQQMQTILKLTKKIEDYTHDIKMIGDVE